MVLLLMSLEILGSLTLVIMFINTQERNGFNYLVVLNKWLLDLKEPSFLSGVTRSISGITRAINGALLALS